MQTEASSAKTVPVVTGVAIGILTFAGLNLWFGQPFLPTAENLPTTFRPLSPTEQAAVAARPTGPVDPGEQVYTSVCAACHQATGQGLPGSFPPLAASEWVTGDPETPIRIVLAGLTGPITVKGAPYNAMMPPPPGLDEEKIATVLTYVRSRFGNTAGAITKEQVLAVKQSLAGRTKYFTAEELTALRGGSGAGAAKPAEGAAPAGTAPAAAAPTGAAPTGAAPTGAPPTGTAPAAPANAPAAKP
jgi:mono/diheme cytochrome c family protein